MRLLKVDGDDLLLVGDGSLLLVEADVADPPNKAVTIDGTTGLLSWDASPMLT